MMHTRKFVQRKYGLADNKKECTRMFNAEMRVDKENRTLPLALLPLLFINTE